MFTLGQSFLFNSMRLYGGGRGLFISPPRESRRLLPSTLYHTSTAEMIEMSLNRKSTSIKDQLFVSIALVAFGAVYNWTTERMERSGYHHGYLSLIVSIGVAGTLLIAGIRERMTSARFFFYFVCSGIPMILGSIYRYVAQRESDKRDLAKVSLLK